MMVHKMIAKESVTGFIRNMTGLVILFHIIGILCVSDVLHTWFNSELPAFLTRKLWKMGVAKNSDKWPLEIESAYTWNRDVWEVWVITQFPTLGHLLTCPVCLSRHVAYTFCILLWLITGVSALNLLGIFFWPMLAYKLFKHI